MSREHSGWQTGPKDRMAVALEAMTPGLDLPSFTRGKDLVGDGWHAGCRDPSHAAMEPPLERCDPNPYAARHGSFEVSKSSTGVT